MSSLIPFQNYFREEQPQREVRVGPRGGTTTRPPVKFSYWYSAVVDLLLSDPNLTQGDVARRLNRTQAWISVIMSTDLFKAYYAQRRAEFNAHLAERISGKLTQVTEAALDNLAEGIRDKGAAMDMEQRRQLADTLLTRLGYGQRQAPSVIVNNSQTAVDVTTSVSTEVLLEARANIRALEELRLARARGQVIEAETVAETVAEETPEPPPPDLPGAPLLRLAEALEG